MPSSTSQQAALYEQTCSRGTATVFRVYWSCISACVQETLRSERSAKQGPNVTSGMERAEELL